MRSALGKLRIASAALASGLALLSWTAPSAAHGRRTTWMTIEVFSETDARIATAVPLAITPSEGCRIDPPSPVRTLHCRDGVAGASLAVDDLERNVDLVLVRLVAAQGGESAEREGSVLTARSPSFAFPNTAVSTRSSVVARFVHLGFEHVLSGLDHVLFMIALFWQAWMSGRTNIRRIAGELWRTATAFTLAHSFTLAATVLGWIRFSANVAEACIAASLVLVALDMNVRDDDTVRERGGRVTLAFAFGLVHGLGFAGALASTRLPEQAALIGLLSFNVGVELGQIAVFALGTALALGLSRLTRFMRCASATALRRPLGLVAYGVGTAGVAMFLARVATLLRP